MAPLITSLNLSLIKEIQAHGEIHGIPYYWGAKPCLQYPFPADTIDVNSSDCSGWLQYLMRRCGFNLPEGSVEQRELLQSKGYAEVPDYSWIADSEDPSKLFICFINPVPGGHAGHVFGVSAGHTIECHGGRGVHSRPAYTPILRDEFSHGFRIK